MNLDETQEPRSAPRRRDRVEEVALAEVVRLEKDGGASARCDDGRELILRHGIPGEQIRVRGIRRRQGTIEAVRTEVLRRSPLQAEPRCRHFGICGGCSFQDIVPSHQLEAKRAFVVEALKGEGLEVPVDPVLAAESSYGYRNKLEFTFGSRRYVSADEPAGAEASFALGFHAPGFHEKVLDIGECSIAFPEASGILASVRRSSRERALSPWDLRSHQGLLRHLVLRKGFATSEIMVNLVTSEPARERIDPLVADLLSEHPYVRTIVQNINRRAATIAVGSEEILHFGPGVIHEELLGLRFAISANSFFQTNSVQAERLFGVILDLAGDLEGAAVHDLYCGGGSITLLLARRARRAVGFESVGSAILDARRNATLNGIENAAFVEGDVLDAMKATDIFSATEVVVVDPPRAGLHPKVLEALLKAAPPRIVFVACNPGAAARQVARLVRTGGYELSAVKPVDLFPQTPHVECVFQLTRGAVWAKAAEGRQRRELR